MESMTPAYSRSTTYRNIHRMVCPSIPNCVQILGSLEKALVNFRICYSTLLTTYRRNSLLATYIYPM